MRIPVYHTTRCLATALAIIGLVPGASFADETPPIVGTWKLMVESQLGNNPRHLVVNADLTGTYGGGDFGTFAFKNIKIDGNMVQFDVTLSVQGQELPSHVTLTLDGNKLTGKLDFGQGEASIVGEKEVNTIVDTTDTTKYEFCSEAWVSLAREYLVAAVGDADFEGVSFSFCETFTDAPANLVEPGTTSTGWYVTVAEGELRVGKGILSDADLRITADYATVLPLARMVLEGNPEGAAEAAKLGAAAAAAGKMSTEGDMTAIAKVPALAAAFAKLHDTMARRTL